MVSLFAGARRRVEQWRICLERDVNSGIIPAQAQNEVDRCYVTVALLLDEASVEMEAVGSLSHRDEERGAQFVEGCLSLAQRMSGATYSEACPLALRRAAARLCAQARDLRRDLWVWLECVAQGTVGSPVAQTIARAGILASCLPTETPARTPDTSQPRLMHWR